MPWIDPSTGQSSPMSPDWRGKSHSSEVYRPEPVKPSPINPYIPVPAEPRRRSSGASDLDWVGPATPLGIFMDKVLIATLKFLFTWGLGAAALAGIVWYGYNALNVSYFPKGSTVGNTTTYKPAEIERFYSLPWHHGEFLILHAPNVVLAGNLDGASIKADGNVTVMGNLNNTSIKAINGVIHARNITNSTLTADDVVLSGTINNSHVWIDGYIFRNGRKTSERTHPFPSGYKFLKR